VVPGGGGAHEVARVRSSVGGPVSVCQACLHSSSLSECNHSGVFATQEEVSLISYGCVHIQSSPGIAAAVSWSTRGGAPPAAPDRLAREQAGCQAVSCGLRRRRIVALRLVRAARAEHTAWHLSDCLRAARLLAPPAPTVRGAVGRAARHSRLGAAEVLAPPAPTVRTAVRRPATKQTLEAALLGRPGRTLCPHGTTEEGHPGVYPRVGGRGAAMGVRV
jgi:hypothetical protein